MTSLQFRARVDQTVDVRVGDAGDGGVVGHAHVPLVEAGVVLDHGVLLPCTSTGRSHSTQRGTPTDVADHAARGLVGNHVGAVKPSPENCSVIQQFCTTKTQADLSQRPRIWNWMFLSTWLGRVQAVQGASSHPATLSLRSHSSSTQLSSAS